MKRIICLLAIFSIAFAKTALGSTTKGKEPAKGYKLTLTIKDNADSIMYLGNYYAGGTYAIDTARINRKGAFVFENKNRVLMPGLYFFTNPSGNYVDFMIYNEEPNFTFETKESSWTGNMKVKGSKENELLFRFQKANHDIYSQIDSALRVAGSATEEFRKYRKERVHVLDSIKTALVTDNPNSMLALMMNAVMEPRVPRTDSAGNQLSHREIWTYYMDHYFDNTRLDDDALIRTPEKIFHERLVFYLDSCLHNASPELICEYVDKMIDKAKPSKENFRYLVHTISEKYLKSNVMSYDAVYVHMVKTYMETGQCFWMSPSSVDMNIKRANTWDNLLIGRTAPELIMKDDSGRFHSLHAMNNKYTLLIFWSPTCGHCKAVIPSLYRSFVMLRDKYDIGAFAVLSEPDEETRPKWREFIKSYALDWVNIDGGEANVDWHEVYDVETTPQIFLLDKDKKIIGKRLNAETFELIINAIEGGARIEN